MNKKLICMALFGSLFTKSLASKRFLRAPEVSEDVINSIVGSLPNLPNEIALNFWPSEEVSLEMTEELTNLFENAENSEAFGEAMGEDMIISIEAEQDFSLLDKIAQLEKIAVPALVVAGLVGGPTTAASVGTILALGELMNEASSLAEGGTIDNAVLAGTVGSIADQALGVSGNAGTGLVNHLGANAIGNLVKDLLNTGSQEANMNDTINTLGELINSNENEEIANQLEGALESVNNDSGMSVVNEILGNASSEILISNLGDMLEGAGDTVESVIDKVQEKAEDLGEKVDDVKEDLGDKMKEAAGKIGKLFGKH